MSVAHRDHHAGAIATLIASLMLAAPHLAAAQTGATHADAPAQVRPGYPGPYLPYRLAGACLPYGACAGLWWDDRRQPRRPIAPAQAAPAEQDIWGTTGSPWGHVRRMPPPTPESHIQPRYRDASTIRPEFAERDDTAPR
jgi:hypothetical protein